MSFYEIATDIKLYAIVRVRVEAEDIAEAKKRSQSALQPALDCMDLSTVTIDGINEDLGVSDVRLTEASLHQDDEYGGNVFEVLGLPRGDADSDESEVRILEEDGDSFEDDDYEVSPD